MRKINNVSVSSTNGILVSRYFKIFIAVLLVLMIAMAMVLAKIYIDVNKRQTEKNNSAKNIISQMDKNIDDYTIFENEEGLLGVSEKNGSIVLEPRWKDIYILSEKRFIVSRMVSGNKRMGIVDKESNIIIPFIFNSFKLLGGGFLGGFTGNNNELFLFDRFGNILTNKLWSGCRYSNDIVYLNDKKNEYRGKLSDGNFRFIYTKINCAPERIPFDIVFTDPEKIESIGIENIERIADITEGYLKYLISNDKIDISELTSEQYFSSLSSNDFFKDCRIKKISNFGIEVSKEKSAISYSIKLVVNYDYSQKDVDLKNISSEIKFNIVSDENNRLVLKSINKTEL